MKNLKTKDCTDNQPKKDISFNSGDTSGSYKGSKYYIKTKGREGYVAYKAISPELELETDWNHTALQAGSKMRKLIDKLP